MQKITITNSGSMQGSVQLQKDGNETDAVVPAFDFLKCLEQLTITLPTPPIDATMQLTATAQSITTATAAPVSDDSLLHGETNNLIRQIPDTLAAGSLTPTQQTLITSLTHQQELQPQSQSKVETKAEPLALIIPRIQECADSTSPIRPISPVVPPIHPNPPQKVGVNGSVETSDNSSIDSMGQKLPSAENFAQQRETNVLDSQLNMNTMKFKFNADHVEQAGQTSTQQAAPAAAIVTSPLAVEKTTKPNPHRAALAGSLETAFSQVSQLLNQQASNSLSDSNSFHWQFGNATTALKNSASPFLDKPLSHPIFEFNRSDITLINQDNYHARLEIHPKDLGKITAEVQVKDLQTELLFRTDNQQIKAFLETNLDLLRNAFQEANLPLQQIQVDYQQFTQHHANPDQGQNQSPPFLNKQEAEKTETQTRIRPSGSSDPNSLIDTYA